MILPTVLLVLMQLYWLIGILGLIDLDLDVNLEVEVDADVDVELQGGATGPLAALAVFIRLGEVPFALGLSLVILNFWVLAMLSYALPISHGGLVSAVLFVPSCALSLYMTRLELMPIKQVFRTRKSKYAIELKILDKICRLKGDLEHGRLGQAEVLEKGTSLVINVRTYFANEQFKKGDVAYVLKKDSKQDFYYISETLMGNEFYQETEE
jgi:hypothetical protein